MAKEDEIVCISCKERITNSSGVARFMCPNCGKSEIVRCKNCRRTAARYTCALCGFSGPN
ncbi:RNA-binding protein [Candidatus Woesearchaeota archaeon CG08_land_8_20_14_0_20_47_9]|nr:MAG: RNA-binding protein [Candidatus Woesearchaeota archaeon CG10_big_fil_rev_8_21_14_0_10_47_5]PIO03347.1 MAG: RNA-binding protein [Candidatus Woesearchaeota archaeon CG08_land_8_20_14_0_20_47_9]HII30401.1 RNA-binding protein [Candidatus Woesearchaeota archaeon]